MDFIASGRVLFVWLNSDLRLAYSDFLKPGSAQNSETDKNRVAQVNGNHGYR